jgi:hypothetical protein
MTSSTLRRCFVTSLALGLSATSALSAQMSAAAAAAAAAAFRGSLVATAVPSYPTNLRSLLQAAALHWQPYSLENRYRILRAAAPSGPWVVDHEVVGVIDTVRRLPPNTVVYFRVVALRQVKNVAWMGVDTTTAAATATVHSTMVPGFGGMPENQIASIQGQCSITPPSTVNLSWARVPNANGYRLRIYFVSGSGSTSLARPDILTRDTAVVQTNVPAANYRYQGEPQYDIANWPGPGQTLSLFGPVLLIMEAHVGPGKGPGC